MKGNVYAVRSMGIANSSFIKETRTNCDLDWIAPSTSRKNLTKQRKPFFINSFVSKYLGNKLQSRFQSFAKV